MTPQQVQLRTITLLAPFLFFFSEARSQQLICNVSINSEAVSTTNKDLLRNFEDDIRGYFDGYAWGQDSDIRINCNIQIFFQSVLGENRYSAQAFIGSSRVIFDSREGIPSDKTTPMLRIKDDNWQFTYVQSRPLNHSAFVFNELTSFLDFYAFLILGYDYDSYELLGGTKWFQNAADVSNLGRSSGLAGWQSSTGSFTRTQLIDDILNPSLVSVRRAGYAYHFTGLDSMMLDPAGSQARMLEALEEIGKARGQTDPRNLSMRIFFDAKHLEIAKIFSSYPDPQIFVRLGNIDPSHISTYEAERAKRE